MQVTFSGSVYYANGNPMSNVVVRIYDRVASGGRDDDLTAVPGLSDVMGRFTVTYEPKRYLDFHTMHLPGEAGEPDGNGAAWPDFTLPGVGDEYLPYLRFNYTYNLVEREHTAPLGVLQAKFYLPVSAPVPFLPSVNGFKFRNCFSGYFLPYSTPAFLNRKVPASYGLCGGMCSAASDFLLAGRPIPLLSEVPSQGSRLQRYLYRRQMDSLGGLGQAAIKVAQWTILPDDTPVGTQRRTADEFIELQRKLDDGNLVVLALVYERASTLKELARLVFNNHQVLAYGYRQGVAGEVTIQVYDPNMPGQDDVVIHAVQVELGNEDSSAGPVMVLGLVSSELVGSQEYRKVRGFFAMPYTPVEPPEKL